MGPLHLAGPDVLAVGSFEMDIEPLKQALMLSPGIERNIAGSRVGAFGCVALEDSGGGTK
ncbi:hypothetical protein BLX41_25495 [Pseudomonas protegens]|nr:hypothetical protein BLX41_25495 [Pseudomonas protegens]